VIAFGAHFARLKDQIIRHLAKKMTRASYNSVWLLAAASAVSRSQESGRSLSSALSFFFLRICLLFCAAVAVMFAFCAHNTARRCSQRRMDRDRIDRWRRRIPAARLRLLASCRSAFLAGDHCCRLRAASRISPLPSLLATPSLIARRALAQRRWHLCRTFATGIASRVSSSMALAAPTTSYFGSAMSAAGTVPRRRAVTRRRCVAPAQR